MLDALLNANPGAKRAYEADMAAKDADMRRALAAKDEDTRKALAIKDDDKHEAVAKARYVVLMEERAMMKRCTRTTCARSAWHFPIS